jgi:16S rRNA (adenine1518-N6/adenine1519-N6)-dimethyltransferase
VPRQKLGQHFLAQSSILERIARAACPEPADLVIEIGPGRGALTEKLLSRTSRLIAIELDSSLIGQLRSRFPSAEILHANVLETDLHQWGPAVICGNLPYYITSPILERVIRAPFHRAVFLIQKEVAERLAASPGNREYGYLTVTTALFATVRRLFDVKPGAFHPPPKVDSSVVLLEPHPSTLLKDPAGFLEFAGRAFRQKRKTIRNNLAPFYGAAIGDWPEAGQRAEQLSLEQLLAMYRRVSAAE